MPTTCDNLRDLAKFTGAAVEFHDINPTAFRKYEISQALQWRYDIEWRDADSIAEMAIELYSTCTKKK